MPRPAIHALMLAGFAGALAPGALVLIRGAVSATLWGPTYRIAAFLNAGAPAPGIRGQMLLVDALVGGVAAALLAFAVVRFARDSTWHIALVFFGGFLTATLALLGLHGEFGYVVSALRQPVTLAFFVTAGAVFWLAVPAAAGRPASRLH